MKAYLRYEPAGCFGVVTSSDANLACDHGGKLLITPALEKTHLWNPKTGALVRAYAIGTDGIWSFIDIL